MDGLCAPPNNRRTQAPPQTTSHLGETTAPLIKTFEPSRIFHTLALRSPFCFVHYQHLWPALRIPRRSLHFSGSGNSGLPRHNSCLPPDLSPERASLPIRIRTQRRRRHGLSPLCGVKKNKNKIKKGEHSYLALQACLPFPKPQLAMPLHRVARLGEYLPHTLIMDEGGQVQPHLPSLVNI